ncbi:MAG: ribosome recycling factor [Victivallales bacterium]|nr:ribosome recycling factor [Lentisphaeria bacterium]HCG27364.1 ribosome recycling factor [Lentisphaeria bacterium]HCG50158.1 ribosome recycling factor [Lentisphaeria bacterium]
MAIEELLDNMEESMMNAEDAMKTDIAAIRTGKASTALVEGLMVEYYGTNTRLRDIAGLSTPDARTVAIQPWDQSAVQAIEKAIINSNIGISPVSDGKIVRLPIPPLSEDRRAALAKQVKARSEEARVAVRNARRDANEAAKKAQKASEITEDELKNLLEKIQKMTDSYIANIDKLAEEKEKELMKV